MLGHGSFWLVTDGVGHDETMSISYLIVRSFSTRRTGDFYHTVRQEFVDSACLVVSVFTVNVVGRILVGAVCIEGQYGLDARTVGSRKCSLVSTCNRVEYKVV